MSNRKIILLVLILGLFLLPFIVLRKESSPWGNTPIVSIVNIVVSPLTAALSFTKNTASSTWNHYISLKDAAIENTQLKNKILLLNTKVVDHEEVARENQRLRKILEFVETTPHDSTLATVIGKSKISAFQTLKLSKGTKHGIMTGMPVTTPGGVVGVILRSGAKYSDLLPITDPGFHVDVLIQRTRVRGILSGYNISSCELKLNEQSDIKIGDLLITSGMTGSYPKGLPVAIVTKVSYSNNNISQAVFAEPLVQLNGLEEAVILKYRNPFINKISTIAGTKWLEESIENEQD